LSGISLPPKATNGHWSTEEVVLYLVTIAVVETPLVDLLGLKIEQRRGAARKSQAK